MLSQWTAYCQTIAVRCVEIVHLAHSHLLESLIHWYTVWWAKSGTSCKSSNKWKPCHSSFTSINWCKNLWIESLCCSWFMLVQFSIAVYIYIHMICLFHWLVPCPKPYFHGENHQSLDNSGRRKHCRVLLGDRIVTPRWGRWCLSKPPWNLDENRGKPWVGSLPKRRVVWKNHQKK